MVFFLIFLLALAFAMAKLEIQIEGGEGWAQNLPTWRIEKHWLLDLFFGGRALTGYHLWVLVFVLMLFHLPAWFVGSWSWALESRSIAGYILMWTAEDFFVVCPQPQIRHSQIPEAIHTMAPALGFGTAN